MAKRRNPGTVYAYLPCFAAGNGAAPGKMDEVMGSFEDCANMEY